MSLLVSQVDVRQIQLSRFVRNGIVLLLDLSQLLRGQLILNLELGHLPLKVIHHLLGACNLIF